MWRVKGNQMLERAGSLFTYSYRKPCASSSYTLITRDKIDGFATDMVKRF